MDIDQIAHDIGVAFASVRLRNHLEHIPPKDNRASASYDYFMDDYEFASNRAKEDMSND